VTSTTPIDVPALKEWAVVVHALLEGEQIVDLRKGGLREGVRTQRSPARGEAASGRAAEGAIQRGRHFELPARRFWLYPTAEHQQPALLKAAYRHWTDLATAAPVGAAITLPGWAEITDVATITEPDHLAALSSKSIWTDEYAQSRLKWKRRDPLWVLVLRVHRLREPIEVVWENAYGGCTSWVPLAGLPDPEAAGSDPVLSDVAFAAKQKGIRDSLPAAVWQAD
jgi:hypothetical protein